MDEKDLWAMSKEELEEYAMQLLNDIEKTIDQEHARIRQERAAKIHSEKDPRTITKEELEDSMQSLIDEMNGVLDAVDTRL